MGDAKRPKSRGRCGTTNSVAGAFARCHVSNMSMAESMRAVARLPVEQQKELAAFLLHLRLEQGPAWRTEMARRIDDKDPVHWLDFEAWKKELASNEDQG